MPSNLESLSLEDLELIQGGTDWSRVGIVAQAGVTAGAMAGATYGALAVPAGPGGLGVALGAVAIGGFGGGLVAGAGEYIRQNRR